MPYNYLNRQVPDTASRSSAHDHSTAPFFKPAVKPVQQVAADEPLTDGMPGQMDGTAAPPARSFQLKPNHTGLPDQLKSGIENLSGIAMDDVRVHYNSDRPAQLKALAYAQGSDIHIGPGQEKHLPHEAWHVVQQRQGRVQPTLQMKQGIAVNDDAGLEQEADAMGARALTDPGTVAGPLIPVMQAGKPPLQMVKMGTELTFSDEQLKYMQITKADYDKAPMTEGKWNEPISYSNYCRNVREQYVNPWTKRVKANNKGKEDAGIALEVENGSSGKGADVGLNKVFTYTFSEAESSSEEEKKEQEQPENETASTGEQASLPETWWWDIDIDPMCLEIRAEPLDFKQYEHPFIADIIQKDIFNVALQQLKLRTGYGGEGGGHISVDYETGFGSNPVNVVKTIVLMELAQKEIDRMVQLIDVFDDKNAPYLFDASREREGILAIRDWILKALTPVVPAEQTPDAPSKTEDKKERRKRPAKQTKNKRDQAEDSYWNVLLKELAVILQKYKGGDQSHEQLKPKPKNWHVPLHYQHVNLEHTRDTDRSFEKDEQRVEFRRLVAQRSYAELMIVMRMIQGWIERANRSDIAQIIGEIKPIADIPAFSRSKEDIARNRGEAKPIDKADRQGGERAPLGAPTELPFREGPLPEDGYNEVIRQIRSTAPALSSEGNLPVYEGYELSAQQVDALGGHRLLPTVPDGDCSINAVLESMGNTETSARVLRARIAAKAHDQKAASYEQAENMLQPGDWQHSDIMLPQLSVILDVQIFIVEPDGNRTGPIGPHNAEHGQVTIYHVQKQGGIGHYYGSK